jgi:hypothetical protein
MDKDVLKLLVAKSCNTAPDETIRGSRKWASSFRAVAEGNDEL